MFEIWVVWWARIFNMTEGQKVDSNCGHWSRQHDGGLGEGVLAPSCLLLSTLPTSNAIPLFTFLDSLYSILEQPIGAQMCISAICSHGSYSTMDFNVSFSRLFPMLVKFR